MKSIRRIKNELEYAQKYPYDNIQLETVQGDIFRWEAVICGHEDNPYAGGVFYLNIDIPQNYPYGPPKCTFTTKIYHPNITVDGTVWLDILTDQWSPSLTIPKAILSISTLFATFYPDSPCNYQVGEIYNTNYPQFVQTTKQWTKRYAQ